MPSNNINPSGPALPPHFRGFCRQYNCEIPFKVELLYAVYFNPPWISLKCAGSTMRSILAKIWRQKWSRNIWTLQAVKQWGCSGNEGPPWGGARPEFPEQPHFRSLPGVKNWENFSLEMYGCDFIWEEQRSLTYKLPSSIEAEILLRVSDMPHWVRQGHHHLMRHTEVTQGPSLGRTQWGSPWHWKVAMKEDSGSVDLCQKSMLAFWDHCEPAPTNAPSTECPLWLSCGWSSTKLLPGFILVTRSKRSKSNMYTGK